MPQTEETFVAPSRIALGMQRKSFVRMRRPSVATFFVTYMFACNRQVTRKTSGSFRTIDNDNRNFMFITRFNPVCWRKGHHTIYLLFFRSRPISPLILIRCFGSHSLKENFFLIAGAVSLKTLRPCWPWSIVCLAFIIPSDCFPLLSAVGQQLNPNISKQYLRGLCISAGFCWALPPGGACSQHLSSVMSFFACGNIFKTDLKKSNQLNLLKVSFKTRALHIEHHRTAEEGCQN